MNQITLVKPTILIEVLPDGRGNWVFGAGVPSLSAPPTSGGAESLPSQVTLESVTINDGTVIYRDAVAGREEAAWRWGSRRVRPEAGNRWVRLS